MTSLRDRVESLLHERPTDWYTPNSLVARLDDPAADGTEPGRETVREELDSLADDGLVERDGSSYRWRRDDAGGQSRS
jgi:hypothetical protein